MQRNRGVEGDHQQGLVVHRQDVAEQHMQQIDIGALDGNDGDAERQRHQIEGGERGVLLQFGVARHQARQNRNREAGDQSAGRHRKQIEPRQQEADRRTRQDGVRHRVADQAHPPQHQEHADRRAAQRQRDHGRERPAHEFEFGKGRDQRVIDHGVQAAREGRSSTAQAARAVVEGLAHPPRLREVLGGQYLGGRAPGHRPARQ